MPPMERLRMTSANNAATKTSRLMGRMAECHYVLSSVPVSLRRSLEKY